MYLVADFIADSTAPSATASTSPLSILSALWIASAAVPDGMALIDLPGQVEFDIDTLASNFFPPLSGASETRLPSRLQPLAALSFGVSVVSLPLMAFSA